MGKKILVTGGRAPSALELMRILASRGHEIYSADSVRFPLSRFSNSVRQSFRVPPPRFAPHAYIEALKRIVFEHNIDILIPTCEEVFYIARARQEIGCFVWSDSFETCDLLHNKSAFIEYVGCLGLPAPVTRAVSSQSELNARLQRISEGTFILKPVYSRFASRVQVWEAGQPAPSTVAPTREQPWLVQQFIDGRHWCTYSIARDGVLLAHATYPSQQRWGMGSSTVFQDERNSAIDEWVSKFVTESGFTGQISFDLIEDVHGHVLPIECNPRTTSGVHLFRDVPQIADVLVDETVSGLVRPADGTTYAIKLALLVRLLSPSANWYQWKGLMKDWSLFMSSSDVIYSSEDVLPVLGQCMSALEFLYRGISRHITATEATADDISYNGVIESDL